MRKKIKKLMTAVFSLALLFGVGSAVNSSASESIIKTSSFAFKINPNYAATKNKGDTVQRTTNNTANAWKVNFKTSDEASKNNANTYTIFYVAEVIKNETNKYGSALHKIKEGSGVKFYSAYKNVSPGPTALYARDNKDGTTESYTITGTWSAQTGHSPSNDGE